MPAEHIPDFDATDKLVGQGDFFDLKNALENIKNELDQTHEPSTENTDHALINLTEQINLLVSNELLLNKESLVQHPELSDLMHDIILSIQKPNIESSTLSEEKKLLLELMYGIAADIGRRNSAQQIARKAQEALSFYTRWGGGKVYSALLKKAEVVA